MLRRLGVRGKILATLATPVLVLVILAFYIVGGSVLEERTSHQTAEIMTALELQDKAGSAYAQERGLAILAKAGDEESLYMLTQAMPEIDEETGRPVLDADGKPKLTAPSAQQQTSDALDERDAHLRDMDLGALPQRVQDSVARTLEDRQSIHVLQKLAAERQLSVAKVDEEYSAYIDGALEVARQLADTSDDRDLALRLNAFIAMDEAMLTSTLERPYAGLYLKQLAATGQPDSAQASNLASIATTLDVQVEAANRYMDRLGFGFEVAPMQGDYLTGHGAFSQSAVGQTQVWWAGFNDAASQWIVDNRVIRDALRDDALAWADAEADLASQRALATGIGAVVIVAVSIITALVIARRLVRPLRRLTDAAGDVRDRLPTLVEQVSVPGQGPSLDLEQIPVESMDEIGQLAAAFNDVNRTTIEVAREQAALRGSIAEMFVNVARRDQVLLNRQLAFLDDLERSEEDPSTLSNLFRLDHLATRMRRNAESLLVLAGIDSGRRVRQPMPVSDVIRTASSEIELYDRVRLNLVVDPLMLGHNALNAAHLLAELLENATMFSEPHTPVDVTTARDSFGVTVVVRDHGLGMTAEELREANRKVGSRAASDAVGAQRLGLFVVGRLADRLGAAVDFAPGQDGTGTQVTVKFPAVLFVPDDAVPLPQPTDPLEASTQAAAAQYQGGPGGYQNPAPALAAGPATSAMTAQNPAPAFGGNVGQQRPASTGTFGQPEAPLAVPVDLDALTDGTTALGLARRRTSRPGEGAPSAGFPMQTATGSIVLPPLVTPELPDEMPRAIGDEQWAGPADVKPAASSALPSRNRSAAPAQPVTPLFEEAPAAPVLDVDQRSALFSSFRSLNAMGTEDGQPRALQLDPVTQDPAALPGSAGDTSVVRFPSGGQPAPLPPARPAPRSAAIPRVAQDYSRPFEESAGFGSEGRVDDGRDLRYEALPAFEELMENLPTRRSIREGGAKPASKQRGIFGRRSDGRPATGELTAYQPESQPVAAVDVTGVLPPSNPSPAVRPTTGYQQAVAPAAPPADPAYQKGFQEGYERALRESTSAPASFGEQAPPSPAPAPAAPSVPTPSLPTPAPAPAAGPLPASAPLPVPSSLPTPAPASPAGMDQPVGASAQGRAPMAPVESFLSESEMPPAGEPFAQPEPFAPAATAPAEPFAPAEPYASAEPYAPAEQFGQSEPFAPVEQFEPLTFGEPQPLGQPERFAPAEQFAPVEQFTPAVSSPPTEVVPIAPTPTAPMPGREHAYEPARQSVPAQGDALDPLDPGYVRDSVEARSEWMASAVLYEEMTSLLRRGAYQEDDVVPENDAYRPAAVTSEPAVSGLTRRQRGASGTGVSDTVDRLSARIERDPEQLRSRLSAFQSATARGRSEAGTERGTEHEPGNVEGASTWAPSTMNHVPDSAPQSR